MTVPRGKAIFLGIDPRLLGRESLKIELKCSKERFLEGTSEETRLTSDLKLEVKVKPKSSGEHLLTISWKTGMQLNCVRTLKDFEFKASVAAFDLDKLQFPLILRNWKKGDSFQPFGMKGRKKVSDFLIDNKVPLPLKNKVLVLTSNNKIVWLVGHRIDDRFKVTKKTKKIYLANLLK